MERAKGTAGYIQNLGTDNNTIGSKKKAARTTLQKDVPRNILQRRP